MRFRNTFAIGVLFLALAGYLYFVENPRQRGEEQQKKLLQFKIDEVSEVTLTYADKQIVLKKTGSAWRMQKPLEVDADQTTVDNLIRAVADAEVKRTLEGVPQSLDTYGLDKPTAIVKLTLASGQALPTIRVGNTAPVGFSAYVQLEGSPEVKTVPSVFQTGMKKEVKDLRNKVIVDFQDDDVQQVDVASGDSRVELVREESDWKVTQPEKLKADGSEVRSFLSSLRGIRAQDFVDQPASLGDYGLDSPRERIAVVVGKDKTRKELLIGAEKEKDRNKELYVKRADADTVYAIGAWAWTGLNKDLAAFRDKTVLPFELASLGAVEVERRDGESYRIVKQGDAAAASAAPPPASEAAAPSATPGGAAWKIDGVASAAKGPLISQLVGDLHGLKGYEIAAEKPKDLSVYGLAAPDVTFSLIDSAGKPIGRVLASQVGSGASANAYAMGEGSNIVYHLRSYLFTHLDKKKSDFLEAPPAPTPPAATPAAAEEE